MSKLEFFLFAVALLNLVTIIEFVRRRKVLETYALLWIGVGLGGMAFALGRSVIDDLSSALGVSYGANFMLAAGILLLLFISMSLTLHISRLEARTEVLAEEVAVLRGVRQPQDQAAE